IYNQVDEITLANCSPRFIKTVGDIHKIPISMLVTPISKVLIDGKVGFRNAKKQSKLASQTAGFAMGKRTAQCGFNNVKVIVRGIGGGRLKNNVSLPVRARTCERGWVRLNWSTI
ncbi:hypothetical protein A3Q56_05293, partial [Intoshia linei]